jgi:lipopolysaccharide biosynthesis protein
MIPVVNNADPRDDPGPDAAIDGRLLRDEVERLQKRVEDLELTVVEYRSQMSEVLSSGSWRLTSPIRVTAARYRTAVVRSKRVVRRMRSRDSPGARVLLAGLFPPSVTKLPPTSPLRKPVDVNSLRRPPHADGPTRRPVGEPGILVVAHVHYPELWGDIDDRLSRMPSEFDLLVTITEGIAESAITRIMERHPRARIEVVPNRGRDWAPLLRLANAGLLAGYDAVAKVHTKKSEHRIDGDGWRLALLDGIFESPEQIRRIVDLLIEDRGVGLVVPTGHVSGHEHWGSDQPIVEMLASRLPMAFDPDSLAFPAGSMFWCRPWVLERLADLDLDVTDFEPEGGQYDATTAHALERFVGVLSEVAGMDVVEAMDVKSRLASARRHHVDRPSIYAFYLPQYHPTAENDEFWGEGFSDWINVKQATPLFEGHRQPWLPGDEVGFYDLRDPEVLRMQGALAREHGIDGFVFHYYWFDGKKVLDTPLNNWLVDPSIDVPLALCWANEPWTRRWDGLANDVLIPQVYGPEWANRFWDDVSPALRDSRYLKVDGAPLLVVYRLGQIPDPVGAITTWRRRAAADGHPSLHVGAVLPSREVPALGAAVLDLADSVISFAPGSDVRIQSVRGSIADLPPDFTGDVMSYGVAFDAPLPATHGARPVTPAVMPGWDNTARRGTGAYVFHGANPAAMAGALRKRSRGVGGEGPVDRLYINAWNEWAEGAAVEPSRRLGRSLLATIADVFPSG